MSGRFSNGAAPRSRTLQRLWASIVVMAGCLAIAIGVSWLNPPPPRWAFDDVQAFDAAPGAPEAGLAVPPPASAPAEAAPRMVEREGDLRGLEPARGAAREQDLGSQIPGAVKMREQRAREQAARISEQMRRDQLGQASAPSASDRTQFLGRWVGSGVYYVFHEDGTFESNTNCARGGWTSSGERIYLTCADVSNAPADSVVRLAGALEGTVLHLEAQRADRTRFELLLRPPGARARD